MANSKMQVKKMRTTMEKLDLFKGMTLSDEEIFVIHGGISIAEDGGIICGGGCIGDDGGGCGIACSNDKFTTK